MLCGLQTHDIPAFDPCPLHLNVPPAHPILCPRPQCLSPDTNVPPETGKISPGAMKRGQALCLLSQGFCSASPDSGASDLLLLQNGMPGRSRGCPHPPARLPGWEVGSLTLTWLLERLAPLASGLGSVPGFRTETEGLKGVEGITDRVSDLGSGTE